MDFKKQVESWARGDTRQGQLMVGIGFLLTIVFILIYKEDRLLFTGVRIPLAILTFANLVYGGFLVYSRPKHLRRTLESYEQNAEQIIQQELKKAETDNRNYSILKPIWGIFIVVCIILFFLIVSEYHKGLLLGLGALFFGFFLIDKFLHSRLKPYLKKLRDENLG